ncbi:GFA family protein [Pseudomonas mangiferae]|uniref:GFA family protein n=1 Tax=Pseudomonas mangiferae TaxID=2593654 RepID=A0A553GTB2_9PSED|nr:GFA family protein [Pseudomonas mangiferae]TRX72727.1 GFA family protein [Pseudomonas mangiferae]
MHIEGQCHCGHVAYQAEIDPQRVGVCHCTDCQALTGCAFRITVSAPRQAITLTANPPKVYEKHGDNGKKRLQHFCPECGSPLFTSGEESEDGEWGIRWGSIAQRAALEPKAQIWRRSAVGWLDRVPSLPGSDTD